jgi:protease YdgD
MTANARRIVFSLVLATLVVPVEAQQNSVDRGDLPVVLYGMGPDPRDKVKVDEAPWRGIGKLVAIAGGLSATCTGALIGPATVLTAGHCLYNANTKSYFPATSVQFLLGLDRGTYSAMARVVDFTVAPGFDPENTAKTRGSDWAVLTLDQKLGTIDRVLAMRDQPPSVGTPVVVGGYSEDYQYILTAALHCRILGQAADGNGHSLLVHDCIAKRGTSGAPLLVRDGTRWTIGGVEVATGRQDTRGVAAIPSNPGPPK